MLAYIHFGSKEDRTASGIIRLKDWIMVAFTFKDSLPNPDKPKITLRGYTVPPGIDDQPFGHLTLMLSEASPREVMHFKLQTRKCGALSGWTRGRPTGTQTTVS